MIVVLLIGRRCTLLLCYRYSDSSITNRYAVHCCSAIGIVIVVLLIGRRCTLSAIGIVIVVLLIGTRYTVALL